MSRVDPGLQNRPQTATRGFRLLNHAQIDNFLENEPSLPGSKTGIHHGDTENTEKRGTESTNSIVDVLPETVELNLTAIASLLAPLRVSVSPCLRGRLEFRRLDE